MTHKESLSYKLIALSTLLLETSDKINLGIYFLRETRLLSKILDALHTFDICVTVVADKMTRAYSTWYIKVADDCQDND